MGLPLEQKREIIDWECDEISVREQCEYLGLSRSTLYYEPVSVSQETFRLMNRLDEIFTAYPFYGSRRLVVALKKEGFLVGRARIRSLMRQMGIEAIYPKINLSKRNPEHKIYPYLLSGLEIVFPCQVWSVDITYIRLTKGFMYLVAVIDWYSRYVLSWRLSNSLEADFCIEALKEALSKGSPKIFNSDQGVQFTSQRFTGILISQGIQISMDSKGRALDNIFVERFWRSLKYEDIYIKKYETVFELKQGLFHYFEFYNRTRPHQALGYKTPWEVHQQSA